MLTQAVLELLVSEGADLDDADQLGRTPVHLAAETGVPEFVQFLIGQGANFRAIGKSDFSTLLSACYQPASNGKMTILKQLLSAGVDMNLASSFGESPLGTCLYFGDFDALRLLLAAGADAAVLEWSALHRAVAVGYIDEVKSLAGSPAAINLANQRYGLSPWWLAVSTGDLAKVEFLAEHGADFTTANRLGESPLHIAAKFGRIEVAKWLIDLGADVNAISNHASAPLHLATSNDHMEMMTLLLGAGADFNSVQSFHEKPIHEACSLLGIQTLVKAGADMNVIDGCGNWPLQNAADANDVERVRWMLANGAKVDLTSTGDTALHKAVASDSLEVMAVLLEAGANPNAQDVDGWTPMFWCQSVDSIEILRSSGADTMLADQAGFRPESRFADPLLLEAIHKR